MRWLHPLAWWGLAAVAIPIVVHLLARDRSRRLPFPSLRFLPVNQTAALRRRVVQHWMLLTVRILMIALAVAALAGPVLISNARRASWNQRVARAVIVASADQERAASMVADETGASFASTVLVSDSLPDALTEGVGWLQRQPPAARELVIVGDLREGALGDRDFDVVPPFAGIRFLPLPRTGVSTAAVPAVADGENGAPVGYTVHVEVEPLRSRVRHAIAPAERPPQIEIAADAASQDHAGAVLRAVLREGVWRGARGNRRLTFAFRGAPPAVVNGIGPPVTPWMQELLAGNPEIRGGEREGVLVATIDMAVTDDRAPGIVARVVGLTFAERFDMLAPPVSSATLARWSRPPGESPAGAEPADEGDRRWLWAGVLLLLGVEQISRSRRRSPATASPAVAETRVA